MTSSGQVVFRRLQSDNLLGTVRWLYFTVSFQLESAVSRKQQNDSGQHAVGDSGVLSVSSFLSVSELF